MAIVQISRIQIRRGQKLVGSGIPQLAGGELGWAVDTRELYIGNGSVSEGSPAVGNSKILTQHDNLFSFADQYTYQKNISTMQTGATPTTPITRTLQDRLDETVSVKSFGALGDNTDQIVQLQKAIDQLYINTSTKGSAGSRVTLTIPPGEYQISASLKVPPHATIVGAGSDKVFIIQTGNFPIIETVNSASTPGSPALDATSTTLNQARHITIKGVTLKTTTNYAGLHLQSCRESVFDDISIEGGWTSGSSHLANQVGIRMACLSTAVNTIRNTFRNITVKGFARAVESKYDIENNLWDKCIFETLGYGFVFGDGTIINNQGMLTGPINNTITNCKFQDIDKQGIPWPLGWLQEIIFRKFGAIPVERKEKAGQYNSVVKELEKHDGFVLIVTPEGRFDPSRFRSSFLYIARELDAQVMPVQIDYEKRRFTLLPALDPQGTEEEVNQQEKSLLRIAKKHQGISGGASNGKRGYSLAFGIAYIRDFFGQFNILGETFETSVPWNKVLQVCQSVKQELEEQAKNYHIPGNPYLSYRVTQTYHTGVCIYFTMAFYTKGLKDPDKIYHQIEHCLRQVILDNGGSLSHHHGIGKIRQGFLPQVHTENSFQVLHQSKKAIDPNNVFGIRNGVFDEPSETN